MRAINPFDLSDRVSFTSLQPPLLCCTLQDLSPPSHLYIGVVKMADADAGGKRRTFRKFTYRGVDLDQLLDMSTDELVDLFPARARRK